MQGRLPSSRPSTSARPTTAFDRDQFQHHQQRPQQQQPREIAEEEYEEESDDEDVFAFLPPTTAEQSTSQLPLTSAVVPYPEPTFDPWDRQYPIPPPPAAPIPPSIHGVPSATHSHPHPYNQPPASPSTDSHPSTGMSGPDFYRLKSLGTAASSKLAVVEDVKEQEEDDKKGVDSQSNSQSQSQTYHQYQLQQHHAGTGILGMPKAASSLADSLSVTHSMLEDDDSRSIK